MELIQLGGGEDLGGVEVGITSICSFTSQRILKQMNVKLKTV